VIGALRRGVTRPGLPVVTWPLLAATVFCGNAGARDYSEQREPCLARDELKRPFFGDLHVHTRYSLDASTQGTRTTPDQAYRFARGEALGIQPWTEGGKAQRSLQLRRPLDFAMVSDHAELIGEVYMCNTPGADAHDSWQCLLYRHWPRGAYYLFNYMASMRASHLGLCGDDDRLCRQAAFLPWLEMQQAAERHYDRSGDCGFTTFVGYEWTGVQSSSGGNLHRNVVFRNDKVTQLPVSFIDAPVAEELWRSLDLGCNGAGEGCESLVIPHNSNLSAGYMFRTRLDDGESMDAQYASLRQRFEPLLEIMQHKGASECYFKAGVTEDELCAFEQLPKDNIAGFSNEPRPDTGFLRGVLTDGMAMAESLGVNPFQYGVIASTDTHLGTPGAADEDRFLGHGGAGVPAGDKIPPGLPDLLKYNPGGLAVLWAEENSRDALFDAMLRKEAYATSGPRIVSRFFGGWNYSQQLCQQPDRVERAYSGGVPMGGELGAPPGPDASPAFLVAASMDPGVPGTPGMPLQRIQIIKSSLDPSGGRRESVFDVAGDDDGGSTVDPASCETSGGGHRQLCSVWVDPEFDPEQRAYYYARVVENPSCRWSQRMCVAAGVDCAVADTIGEGYEGCCAAEHRPIIQERAWTSPIWYVPAGPG
jgi:hypothetical protein